MLNNPKLALCSNRSTLPKSNEKSGSPEEWFTNNLLATHGLVGINFDFFVNWSATPNVLTPVIWIKQVLSLGKSYPDFLADIKANLLERFGESFLKSIYNFSLKYSLEAFFVILDDEQNWNDPESLVCLIKLDADLSFTSEMLSIDNFKILIKNNSGGPVHVGNKGLIYGTTNLECLLSKTDSAYPGDMDMLLLNEDADPVAIFEFKKHTLTPDVSRQTLSNYYPKPDARKYDRLAIFRNYIFQKSGVEAPIFVLYYPSNPLGVNGRTEVIVGPPGKLVKGAGGTFKLPTSMIKSEYERMADLIPKIIKLNDLKK